MVRNPDVPGESRDQVELVDGWIAISGAIGVVNRLRPGREAERRFVPVEPDRVRVVDRGDAWGIALDRLDVGADDTFR